MEPSDTDGRVGGETPGEMPGRLIDAEQLKHAGTGAQGMTEAEAGHMLDAIASAFKAAVLKGEV
jgi:hypothetical protein